MKIGILTQPLYHNYGGIVQCYALQQTLKRMGHEVFVLQRELDVQYSIKNAFIFYVKYIVKLLKGERISCHYFVSQEKLDYISQNTDKFIEHYIPCRSEKCFTTEKLAEEVESLHLDAIIVGSDQVWRPEYSPCQPNYFLDFLPANCNIKRISYAASFGGDEWNWNPNLEKQCALLLQKFDAVSVRETSAIGLCKEHFNVDAIQVLDPTMLLETDDYRYVFEKRENSKSMQRNSTNSQNLKRGTLFNYVLDKSSEKKILINYIAEKTGKQSFSSMPELDDSTYNLYGDIERAVYPPVEDWLSAFDEADIVVTDSFHGAAFSIIFNKPFWVIGNEGRGMARFESLLSMFELQDRLITVNIIGNIDLNAQIDWLKINEKRRKLQFIANGFLKQALL